MRQSAEFKLGADILRDAGIGNRKAAYRALNSLEVNSSLEVTRKSERRPIVRLTSWQSSGYLQVQRESKGGVEMVENNRRITHFTDSAD